MADNVVTGTTGVTVLADEITDATLGVGVAQYVKIMDGTLGSTGKLTVDPDSNALHATLYTTAGTAVAFNSNGQATAANSAPVVIASDRQNSIAYKVALTATTSNVNSGDLLFDTQQCDAFFNKADGRGVINSLTIVDQDAAGFGLYVMFHSTTTSMGTELSAPTISDANLQSGLLGVVAVGSGDYITVSGAKVACIQNIGIPVSAVSGTDDLYVSVLNGTSTGNESYTATGFNLTIGALLD